MYTFLLTLNWHSFSEGLNEQIQIRTEQGRLFTWCSLDYDEFWKENIRMVAHRIPIWNHISRVYLSKTYKYIAKHVESTSMSKTRMWGLCYQLGTWWPLGLNETHFTFDILGYSLHSALSPTYHVTQSQSNLRARIEINCNQQIIVLDYSGLTFQLNVFKIECWSFVVISHINTTSENNG